MSPQSERANVQWAVPNAYLLCVSAICIAACGTTAYGQLYIKWLESDGGNNHVYIIEKRPEWCATEGHGVAYVQFGVGRGSLATITSAAEQQIVRQLLVQSGAPTGAYFIGLRRNAAGAFEWETGERMDFTAWFPGEPNNGFGGIEDRGSVLWTHGAPDNGRSGFWNDVPTCIWGRPGYIDDYGPGGLIVEGPCMPTLLARPGSSAMCPNDTSNPAHLFATAFSPGDGTVQPHWYRVHNDVSAPAQSVIVGDDGITVIGQISYLDTTEPRVTPNENWTLQYNLDKWYCVFSNECGTSQSASASILVNLADVGSGGGVFGSDGRYDNNDFIVFIDLFFSASPLADVASPGGLVGPDGQFDNNDFVVFINEFFRGC